MVLVSGDTLSDESMQRLLTDCFAAGYASRLTDEELIEVVGAWSESSDLTPDQAAQLIELLDRFEKLRPLPPRENTQTEETQRLFLGFAGVCVTIIVAYLILSYFLGW